MRMETKRILASLSAARRQAAASAATALVLAQELYRNASLVLAFLSMSSEIDTTPLIAAALRDGKRVAVPRIEGDEIAFVELDQEWRTWPRDRWDIPTPPVNAAAVPPEAMAGIQTLALVPGLAFDSDGGRLGRGKGYYDRFLATIAAERLRHGDALPFVALGYGFEEQRVNRVPTSPLDRPLDGLVLA